MCGIVRLSTGKNLLNLSICGLAVRSEIEPACGRKSEQYLHGGFLSKIGQNKSREPGYAPDSQPGCRQNRACVKTVDFLYKFKAKEMWHSEQLSFRRGPCGEKEKGRKYVPSESGRLRFVRANDSVHLNLRYVPDDPGGYLQLPEYERYFCNLGGL